MKKISFLGLLILISIIKLTAQELGAAISFKEEKFDFGTVKEEDGPINHVFEFTNIGGTPLIINNVQASCGCTTPDWSKQPVSPGDKGFVKATYNPSGRGGTFNKTITVTSNSTIRPTMVLTITGTVIGKKLSPEPQYTQNMDSVRFISKYLSFETLFLGTVKTDSLQFINISHNPVKMGFVNVPDFLKVTVIPSTIKPGEKGYIKVTYSSAIRNDWDFLVNYLYLTINGKQDPVNYKITITATIAEDFKKLTYNQLINAPKIKFDKGVYDFGTAKAGDKLKFSFTYKNEGNSDLILHKIKTSCSSCISVDNSENSIKPGGTGIIKVVFDTRGQKNNSGDKTITCITNDPKNTKMILYIRGIVN